MAKNININRNVQDPFYRYKMPRIMAKVEGKGNGIKTVIANMPEIAKALARPPTYPTKYFGCELGAQTNFDLKNDRYIVNGDHDAGKLQDILDGFIKKFVLCPNCENPETVLTVKRQTIHGKCKACGHAFIVDPKQKLSTFILKNPPPIEGGAAEGENGEEVTGGEPANGVAVNTNDEFGGSGGDDSPGSNDDDWAPEPVEGNEKLVAQIGKLVIDKDLDKPLSERLDMLHKYFIEAKNDGSIKDSKAIVNEAERLELKSKAPLLLANVLFDTDVLNQLEVHRPLLLRFCMDDKKAQRHLIGGIEQLIQENKDALLPKTAHLIKALYDTDICSEEALLSWGAKPSGKFVSKNFAKELIKIAQPVLNWLNEAEEESDSDEDGDVAVDFDDRARVVGTTVVPKDDGGNKKQAPSNGDAMKDDSGEEIDIDDI